MFVLVSVGGRNGYKYEVKEVEEVRGDVFDEWEEVGSGMWCEECDVIVLGDSKEECVSKLMDYDEGEYEEVNSGDVERLLSWRK